MPQIPRWLFNTITIVIITAWLGGLLYSAVSPSFHMPPELSSVVAIILGALYGGKAASNRDRDTDNDSGRHQRRDRGDD